MALVLVVAGSSAAGAAGRRPYGGALDVPVSDYSGLVDPHLVTTRSGRLVASLVHGHLFRVVGSEILPDLVADSGDWAQGALTLELVAGARFHDGSAVTSADVVASIRRLAAFGRQSSLGELVGALTVSQDGARKVVIKAPAGSVADEVRALLARPEVAILKGGKPAIGCGAFKPGSAAEGRRVLVSWDGYAGGRPWIQEVRLVQVASGREEAAFRFGEVELAFEPLRMTPSGTTRVSGGWTSWLAVLHPRFRGAGGNALRAWLQRAAIDARLGRYVDGRSAAGRVPWPSALAPVTAAAPERQATPRRDHVVVAFAEGESDSAELARAVRDVMRPVARIGARIQPIAGLDARTAWDVADPPWDVALIRWDWAALTHAQAAFELAWLMGARGPSGAAVLARKTADWARGLVSRYDALAFVHVERPASLHASIRGAVPAGTLPYLVEAWSEAR